jgi:thiaminase/transcriptional activator TenA
MREAADTRSYAAALSVLVVAEWLYLDWASRAPQPLPNNFVHAEWITLHDSSNFRGFVDFLRTELDRVGPAHADLCRAGTHLNACCKVCSKGERAGTLA